ncbi:MAG: hypothetical protein ACR2PF_09160 [Rhizobiaceae bacterium]
MFMFQDVFQMISDIRDKSLGVWIWGGLLNIPQFLGGLYFITAIEGLLVFVTLVLTQLIAAQIHRRFAFSRLIVFCHLPWLALLPWLTYRLVHYGHDLPFRLWLYYVSVTILISLIFEFIEAYRYLRGDKTFSWAS